ncbi:MAG: hypothetical protein WCO56_16500 [Verrucomicrobiota bacterium]
MKVRSVILLSLDAFGGIVSGKTMLQKRLFFMAQYLKQEWGFNAHYYGPYSNLIASELVTLKVQGLVAESCLRYGGADSSGFEKKRCDYTLTETGKNAVQWLKKEFPNDSNKLRQIALRIVEAGDLGYEDLSIAAKAYFILKQSESDMLSTAEIADKARKFSWQVTEPQISKACGYLVSLGLVKAPRKAA